MFTWIKNAWSATTNWIGNLFSSGEEMADELLLAFNGSKEELRVFLDEMLSSINDDDKHFIVSLKVTSETKIKPLKATMATALVDKLQVTNPEIDLDSISVKSYYNTKK